MVETTKTTTATKKATVKKVEAKTAEAKIVKKVAVKKEEGKCAKAICTSIRTSPYKLNLVAESIRGLSAEKAVAELTFSKKRVAQHVLSTLKSAIANAENNHSLNIDKLVVSQSYVGKGLVMKRMHARGRGRGARVLKPFSNLTIILTEKE